MLTEGRSQRTRHSFHSLPRTRLDSMDRLEKYSLLLKKEKQVLEKSEKAARLAAKCFTTLDEYNETAPTTKSMRTSSHYGTLPRMRRNTADIYAKRANPFERPPMLASKSLPETEHRTIPLSWFNPTPQTPVIRWKDRPHSVIITTRFQEARDRHNKRRERVKSLEDDCVQAKKIIEQMKAMSMPLLREPQSNLGRGTRRSLSEVENNKDLPARQLELMPCKVDIIDC